MNVDLHMHTTCSDGLYTPEQLTKMAAEAGLSVMAISDHDTVAAYSGHSFAPGIRVIPAIEMSSDYDGEDVHVLGYYIRPDQKDLMDYCARFKQRRLDRALEIADKCVSLGYDIDRGQIEGMLAKGGTVGRPHIARMLVAKGYFPDVKAVFDTILYRGGPAYVPYHRLTVDEEVLNESIRLAKRYLTEKCLPASAIDLLDRTMSHVKIEKENVKPEEATPEMILTCEDLSAAVARQTGIPLGKVQTQERDRLMGGEETLKKRVVGQDHAVRKVLDAVYEARSGLSKKGQPMGSFFFLGPTGTGKTELSKALAEFLFGDESALLRFDMSEFKEEHSVALLYGAPPGYVGYEEGGLLVNKIRQNPYSVVLFDEIEKAHKSVFDLFLQILDEGKLHDRLGRVGDFSNALILFTSNIGAQTIVERFNNGIIPENNELMDIMQGFFRPEFLARLTEIVPFSPITDKTVAQIFDIHMKGLLKLLAEQDITLTLTPEARQTIALRGYNQQYGARPVLGVIRKELRHPISKMMIAGKIKSGDHIEVQVDKDGNVLFDVKN